jgi:hypothetical protein
VQGWFVQRCLDVGHPYLAVSIHDLSKELFLVAEYSVHAGPADPHGLSEVESVAPL